MFVMFFSSNIPGTLDTSFYSPIFIDFISIYYNSSIHEEKRKYSIN